MALAYSIGRNKMLMTMVKATREYFSLDTEATSEMAYGRNAYELEAGKYYAGLLYDGCLVEDPSDKELSVYYGSAKWTVFKAEELEELDQPVNLRHIFRRWRQ
jgi:hypothetical protein